MEASYQTESRSKYGSKSNQISVLKLSQWLDLAREDSKASACDISDKI